jgi:hypothetical protein
MQKQIKYNFHREHRDSSSRTWHRSVVSRRRRRSGIFSRVLGIGLLHFNGGRRRRSLRRLQTKVKVKTI